MNRRHRGGSSGTTAENKKPENKNHMLWIYSLATIVLAIPGAVVSSLMLIERGRKRRENHAGK